MKLSIVFCLFLLISGQLIAQLPSDTLSPNIVVNDSVKLNDTLANIDTATVVPVALKPVDLYNIAIAYPLQNNLFLNTTATPITTSSKTMGGTTTNLIFYLILANLLLLAFLRFFYTSYFNNLFRVFFNTSLRQSQLTDQLLQAKLPSMLFNLFFVLTGGLFIYLLMLNYGWVKADNALLVIGACILMLAIIYLIKHLTLQLTGWLTGSKEVASTYLFIIFLINKIESVLLLPFVILIAFAMPGLKYAAIIISMLMVSLMFLLRFLRSFSLLQHKIKVSWFHFLIFITGIELLPILLIYKGLVVLLTK